MLKYICGGVGLTSIGLGLQPYITALQPYSLWFILGGVFVFLLPFIQKLLSKKQKKEINGDETLPADLLGFPPIVWLTVMDILRGYELSIDKLKQHIKNGLPTHVMISGTDKTRPLDKDRDLIALEVWPEQAEDLIGQWRFKTEDVEKYIKNT